MTSLEQVLTVGDIRRIAGEIAERHGVERMFLFGSYARGDAKQGSYLSFLIDGGRIRGLFALGSLYADLEEAFGVPIDLLTTDSLDADFRSEIASDEVRIYGPS